LIENKNWLITGSNDNTARIWDFNSGKEISQYKLNHDMATIPAVRINQEATRYEHIIKLSMQTIDQSMFLILVYIPVVGIRQFVVLMLKLAKKL
jgi:hypothetical protein